MGTLNFPVIDAAIANTEGYGVSGAIPTLANNPGDLAIGDIGNGTLGNGITIFPSSLAGLTALDNQVGMIANGTSQNYSPNESINQIGQTYAGAGQQGTNWSQNFAKFMGVNPNSTFGKLLGKTSNLFTSNGLPSWASNTQNNFAGKSASGNPFNLGRVAAFLIGIIAIAMGLFMLKSTQTIIETSGKVAKKVVELSG